MKVLILNWFESFKFLSFFNLFFILWICKLIRGKVIIKSKIFKIENFKIIIFIFEFLFKNKNWINVIIRSIRKIFSIIFNVFFCLGKLGIRVFNFLL